MRALTVSLAILAATIVGGAAWQIAHRAAEPASGSIDIQVKPVAPPSPPPQSTGQMDVGLGMDDIHPQPVTVPVSRPPVSTQVAVAPVKPEPTVNDGYEWAASQGIYSHRECPNSPIKFSAGCHGYVQHIQDGPSG